MKSISYYIDKIIFLGYILLFGFTPLIMSHLTSELFEFNKMLFIYLVTLIIFILWLIKSIILKKIIIKRSKFDIVIILFFISQVISTIFSIDKLTSIFGYYGRFNGGLLSIISYLLLYYGFISNLNKDELFKVLKISLITSLLVIIWGLPGKINYDLTCFLFTGQLNNSCWTNQFKPSERLFSTLGQPNWLAAYLVINFFLGLFFYLRSVNKNELFWLSYFFINIMTLLFTRSRSALLALVFGFFIFILYFFFKLKKDKKKIYILFFIFLLNFFLFKTGIEKIDYFLNFSFIKVKTLKKTDNDLKNNKKSLKTFLVTDSGTIRKIVWQGALKLAKKYPWVGTGVETFAYAYYFVRPKEHNLTSEWDYIYNKAHNEFLNYLATTGFIGLGSYLLMIFSVFCLGLIFFIKNNRGKFKNDKEKLSDNQLLVLILLLSYLSILITNFFGFSTTVINLYFYLIPGFLVILQKEKERENQVLKINLKQKVLILFTLLISIIGFYYFINYWRADYYYARGKEFLQINRYQEAALFFNKALSLRNEHVYQDKLSYTLANLALISYTQNQKDLVINLIKLSDYYNNQSLISSPKNILYWKTKLKINYLFYQITSDKKYLKTIVQIIKQIEDLAPTDPSIFYTESIIYSSLFDEEKAQKEKSQWQKLALKSINQAIDLKPDFRDAYILKSRLLKKFGNSQEAKRTLELILEKIDSQDQEVKNELKNF